MTRMISYLSPLQSLYLLFKEKDFTYLSISNMITEIAVLIGSNLTMNLDSPNNSCMYLRSIPFSNRCVANEWRRLCIVTSFLTPARLHAISNIL